MNTVVTLQARLEALRIRGALTEDEFASEWNRLTSFDDQSQANTDQHRFSFGGANGKVQLAAVTASLLVLGATGVALWRAESTPSPQGTLGNGANPPTTPVTGSSTSGSANQTVGTGSSSSAGNDTNQHLLDQDVASLPVIGTENSQSDTSSAPVSEAETSSNIQAASGSPSAPATYSSVVKHAVHIQGTISADDYPTHAIAAGEQGVVRLSVEVGPNGRPMGNCLIDESSGFPDLDDAACKSVKQKFVYSLPLDRNGNWVVEFVQEHVNWRL